MKKVLFLFGCITLNSFAQTKQHPLIPVSPTAAALGKYGDIDVSLYTGQINPSIKLFNIQFNDFSFPISLNYASSGLKVHEIPASVGMGWSISGTNTITRQIRSVPDEQTHGYNGANPTATIVQSINNGTYTPTTAYSSISEDDFKRGIGETNFDGEPDLFNFSFSGGGGKFFFDETQTNSSVKLATIIPRQPLRIIAHFENLTGQLFNSQNQNGIIEDFEITDSKGIKYTFAKQEGALLADDEYQYGKDLVNTWYLTKIETPNGNTLDFNYIQRTIDQPHAQSEYRFLYEFNTGTLDSNPHITVSQSTTTETVLQEILINGGSWGKIEFIEDTNNREDWSFSLSGTKPKALKEVRLKDGQSNLVRKFLFNYQEGSNRLLLRSVQEFGSTTINNEPYVFEYYDESYIPTLPYGGSNVISKEDNWGYYNANTSGSLLPDFQIIQTTSAGVSKILSSFKFDNHLDSLKKVAISIKDEPSKGIQSVQTSYTYFVTATNRSPDFNSAIIGQLKKITYPTKGFSEFIYEPNSYYAKNDENFNPCAGDYQTISSVTDNSAANNANITDTFTIPEGGFSCLKVNWVVRMNSPDQDIIETDFVISSSDFTKHFVNQSGSQYLVLFPGTYTITLNMFGENALGTNTSNAYFEIQGIPTTTGSIYSTRTSGGVRIKQVKDCPNSNENECLYKEYRYTAENDSTISSGRIVTNGKYSYPVKYFTTDNGGNTVNANYLNSASQLPLSTTLGQYIGYNTVIVKEVKLVNSSKVYKGKTIYDYRSPDENEITDLNAASFPFWSVSYDWKRGVIEQTKVYDEVGDWLKKDTNQYVLKTSLNYSKYASIKAGKFIHNIEASPLGYDPNMYTFSKYLSVSGFQFNQQTTNKEQFKSGSNLSNIQNITQFTYDNDNHLQLTQTSTTNSKGETVLTQYKYPNDITAGDLLPSATLLVNRKSELLQTETFLNASSISKTQNFFSDFGGKAQLSSQKTFVGGSTTPATESQQLSYDSYGNLTSFKEVGGATNSFLWGYNGQYPVVYITNGVPANAADLLTVTDVAAIETKANVLRDSLKQAQISSFNFKPMVGLTRTTAPNQLKTTFIYDDLGRLSLTQDHDNNKLVEYNYQIGTINRITTKEYRYPTAGVTLSAFPTYDNITHAYFDGLGRPTQQVAERRSPNVKDIVLSTKIYDGFGRVSNDVAPFPSTETDGSLVTNPVGLAQSFYTDTAPYSTNNYESSPLNRLETTFGIGNTWRLANKKWQYFDEVVGSSIRLYTADASGNIILNGFYPTNSLYQKRTIDEQGNTSIEIIDKQGKLIQKQSQIGNDYLTTYTIYDDLGRVSAILQPEIYALNSGISQGGNDWQIGVFFYKYDAKGRISEKHIPNGGNTYMVYDKLNREVLSQDENQRINKLWAFQKYDAFGRNILSGELKRDSTQALLQTVFDSQTTTYETFDSTKAEHLFYSNVSFPFGVDTSNVMQTNFYDNYSGWRDWIGINFGSFSSNPYSNATGLLTGTHKRFTQTREFLGEALYYDKKNRWIYSRKKLLGEINPIPISNNYSFDGSLSSSDKIIFAPNQNVSSYKSYGYDFAGRKTSMTLSINNERADIKYEYDEIGRLKQKKIQPDRQYGVTDNGADFINRPPAVEQANTQDLANKAVIIEAGFAVSATDSNVITYLAEIDTTQSNGLTDAMQTINYDYHIRGQVNCINCRNKQVRLGNKENDLFSMKLDFEEDKRYYDGNISRQTWKNPHIANNQQYKHSYDATSRLTKSVYSGKTGSNFSLDTIRYDRNGNILALKRHTIDDLSYIYNGNQLLSVNDGGTTDGFKDGNTSGNDYAYWADGSLKKDLNKGIDSIVYNSYLKKVSRVKFANGNWINFYYDGSGTLLKRKLSNGDEWLYMDELILKNNKVYQLNHDEGRAVYDTINNKWNYEFEYRDILGNLRLSFKDSLATPINNVYAPPVILQISETDALGLQIDALSYENGGKDNFKYQNQEKINDFGLKWNFFNFRFSDEIGRFWQIDPLAEKYVYNSPYALQENKFGKGIELEGLEVILLKDIPKNKPIIKAAKSGIYADDSKTKTVHVFAHGNPKEFFNDTMKGSGAINEGSELNNVLNQGSSLWKNSKDKNGFTVVIHSCRTGRCTTDKNGNKEPSVAEKISSSPEMEGVTIIAPDQRDGFTSNGYEVGPQATKNTDQNGDYLPNTPDNEKGKQTSQFGNWNSFKNGKMIDQQRGNTKPTGKDQRSFWEKLFN